MKKAKTFTQRRTAILLAAMLAVPVQPSAVVYAAPAAEVGEEAKEGRRENMASPDNAVSVTDEEFAKTADSAEKSWRDEVIFNTGNYEVHVVDHETFEEGEGDAFFAKDGSYTINIPENNPFFPYEVKFTGKNGTDSQWFMTPEDSVEVDGHEFFVSAYFDGTVVTQMSLEVAGDTVVVYPEEKEFTDGDGAESTSLLPLQERRLTVDLRNYNPVELTMVSIGTIFQGENELESTDKVTLFYGEDKESYQVRSVDETMNLSRSTCDNDLISWQMIVGDFDQLATANIRYLVTVQVTRSADWIKPVVFNEDTQGNRKMFTILESSGYRDYMYTYMRLNINIPKSEWLGKEENSRTYIGIELDETLFGIPKYDDLRVYEERHQYEDFSVDITDPILNGAGYDISTRYQDITIVTYRRGEVTGCLPVRIQLNGLGNYVEAIGLYNQNHDEQIWNSMEWDESYYEEEIDCEYVLYDLKYGYKTDDTYYLVLNYWKEQKESPSSVTASYAGIYSSISEAEGDGAENIKNSLFNQGASGGYGADYSQGVYFSVFVGEDNQESQEIHYYCVRTVKGMQVLDNTAVLHFDGLRDERGEKVNCYVIEGKEDSYADYNYRTILVDSDTDLTKLAPEFITASNVKLYTSGNSSPEITGKSIHDFSNGPVQYTASAENGGDSQNYWLQVVKPEKGKLYINSLADANAGTTVDENGVVHSTREMFLNGRYNYEHSLLLINMDTEPIENLKVELATEDVELDEYWTLNGKYDLEGFRTLDKTTDYGQLPNMAKILFFPTDYDGRDITGTLTVKSGDRVLMVLTLTGTAGDPGFITTDIPDAVQYVPYGAMLQNSNKYSWNTTSYRITEGNLPKGLTLKDNGELYGVPTETGEFTFTVFMKNSFGDFTESERTFTLAVGGNSDKNVEEATDKGYELTTRISDVPLNSDTDYVIVSEGAYDEFVALYLDGAKLTDGEDYISEEGSTRITIKSQTLTKSNTPGTHTLGIEFREKKTNTLRRAAQNFKVTSGSSQGGNQDGSGASQGGSGGNSSSGRRSGSSAGGSAISTDPRKGYIHAVTGIITGEGAGYSRWLQDENGWKLIYADGTTATGTLLQMEDGDSVEQILWELVDGSWYAFGVNGYLKSGWVYDYQLGSWYLSSADNGMQSGWYTDPQDGYTYYMEPETGKLAAGWRVIDGKWYYFQAVSQGSTWELDRENGKWFYNTQSKGRPFGAMCRSEKTPDGYVVDDDGVWKEEEQ